MRHPIRNNASPSTINRRELLLDIYFARRSRREAEDLSLRALICGFTITVIFITSETIPALSWWFMASTGLFTGVVWLGSVVSAEGYYGQIRLLDRLQREVLPCPTGCRGAGINIQNEPELDTTSFFTGYCNCCGTMLFANRVSRCNLNPRLVIEAKH